jgi:Domain of unknown function (DUF4372)/Transposase DDE domain
MNTGKYVFAQIASFLPQRQFDRIVLKYKGNYKIRHFTCWNQLLCMMFGQLSSRGSLRDLVLTINAHPGKLYHLGFGSSVSKTNLAKANEQRSYLIYEELATLLIAEARKICLADNDSNFSFANAVYAFDSTTIDLCLNVFRWATFRKHKGAVKLHTLYDVKASIPVFIDITAASTHDVNAMDNIPYEPGSFYIFDRGYLDFGRMYFIHQSKSFFIIRAKHNLQFKRMYSAADKTSGVRCDQTGTLKGYYSHKGYPENIRRIKFYDKEQKRSFVFLTNNMQLKAVEIASLYKHRWKIELFFKWMKQHLKITAFWGRSSNAVKTQVYIAIITYTLVSIIKQKLSTSYSTYEILQILGASLLDKTQLNQLLQKNNNQDVKELLYNQLKIF